MNAGGQHQARFDTVEEYIQRHPDADPKSLLDVLLAQNVRIREEYKATAEVEIDDALNFRPRTLAQLQRLARLYAESGLLPDHYAGNIAACSIAIQMAMRCRVEIFTFLQSSYVVYGKPSMEAKLAIGMLNASGQIDGRVRFRFAGEGKHRACTAYAIDKASGEEVCQTVTWEMVEAERWDRPKKDQISKWLTLPDLMFQYRSGVFLIRTHYPDVLLGLHTLDEIEDIRGESIGGNGDQAGATSIDELSDRLGADRSAVSTKGRRKASKATAIVDPEESQTQEATAHSAQAENDQSEKTRSKSTAPSSPQQTPPAAQAAATQQTAPRPAGGGRSAAGPQVATETQPPARTSATVPEGIRSRQPAQPPAGPVAPAAAPQQPGPRHTQAGIMQYIKNRYAADMEAFDCDKLSATALGQSNPIQFVDLIVTKRNPAWANFIVRDTGPVESDHGDQTEDFEAEEINQDAPATEEAAPSGELPDCVTNPLPRPEPMSELAQQFEKQIVAYRQAARIRKLAEEQVRPHQQLDTEEAAYLLDLADRRSWQLENGQTPDNGLTSSVQ